MNATEFIAGLVAGLWPESENWASKRPIHRNVFERLVEFGYPGCLSGQKLAYCPCPLQS